MKNVLILMAVGCGGMLLSSQSAQAQELVEVEEVIVDQQEVECQNHYSTSWRDNWYIQLGAGMQVPFVERSQRTDKYEHCITAIYNVGFGHWFSPYLGFRVSGYYGRIHYETIKYRKANSMSANLDLTWDMLNSLGGVNPNRVFSIIPYLGVGYMYNWDFSGDVARIGDGNDHRKTKQSMLPVSTGIQLRFRLCKYVDFFAEARAQWVPDNFNNEVVDDPIECDLSVIGGLSFTIGGRKFTNYNPCDYLDYINTLNGRVNELRGALATTQSALAAAEAQLPCPEVVEAETVVQAPLFSSVRFKINSARISDEEMVNVYNTAQYMKANPNVNVIVQGFADKDTGTPAYNMELSQRRCQAVVDVLTKTYGIDPARLTMQANGSDVQPYAENDWNRIVLFTQPM